jgi:hypothetical protein
MIQVQGIQTQVVNINVNLEDVVKALSKKYLLTDDINSIVLKNGYLCIEEDVSYHGSPIYEYRKISDNTKLIEFYEALKIMNNFNEKDFTK